MEGLTRGPYEIFEIILVVSLFLVISSAILFTSDPEFKNNKLISTEISLVSSISNQNSNITFNYPQTYKIHLEQGNKIVSSLGNNQIYSYYIGNNINIIQNDKQINIYKNK